MCRSRDGIGVHVDGRSTDCHDAGELATGEHDGRVGMDQICEECQYGPPPNMYEECVCDDPSWMHVDADGVELYDYDEGMTL